MAHIYRSVEEVALHLPEDPTEEDAKALLAQYPQWCGCWKESRIAKLYKNGTYVDRCLVCYKSPELRWTIVSVVQRAKDKQERERVNDGHRKFHQIGEWRRIDGKKFLKTTPVAREGAGRATAKRKREEDEAEYKRLYAHFQVWAQAQQGQQ